MHWIYCLQLIYGYSVITSSITGVKCGVTTALYCTRFVLHNDCSLQYMYSKYIYNRLSELHRDLNCLLKCQAFSAIIRRFHKHLDLVQIQALCISWKCKLFFFNYPGNLRAPPTRLSIPLSTAEQLHSCQNMMWILLTSNVVSYILSIIFSFPFPCLCATRSAI